MVVSFACIATNQYFFQKLLTILGLIIKTETKTKPAKNHLLLEGSYNFMFIVKNFLLPEKMH